jgi:cytochrome c oxidase subunit 4
MKPSRQPVAVSDLLGVFAGLLVLLLLSAATAALPPAPWKAGAGLAIAVAKTALIAWFFMQLRAHRGLIRVFASVGLFWLGLFAVLLFSDYLTRGWR